LNFRSNQENFGGAKPSGDSDGAKSDRFNPEQAAAFYAAKYAAKQLGFIHFGGTLAGTVLHHFAHTPDGKREWRDALNESSKGVATHGIVSPSVDLPRDFYRMTLNREKR
jgi:hypothetical protein